MNPTSRKRKILIPNGTSLKNVGDMAILEILVAKLLDAFPDAVITLHTTDCKLYKSMIGVARMRENLYSWAVFQKPYFLHRIWRMSMLMTFYILSKAHISLPAPGEFGAILNDYREADVIVFVGGGSMRSKKGVKQTLNLLMYMLLIDIAIMMKAPVLIAPISFGPFAYRWQERLVARVLKRIPTVTIRDDISLAKLAANNVQAVRLSDLALLTAKLSQPPRTISDEFVLGVTIRDWLPAQKQTVMENAIIDVIERFARKTGAIIQPIVQVSSITYGDIDAELAEKLAAELTQRHVSVRPPVYASEVASACRAYAATDMVLGMRMHSNILAATQHTPFVAIAYEYKTQGVSRDLGLEKYCINCDEVNHSNLYELLTDAYENHRVLQEHVIDAVNRIQSKDSQSWDRLLSKISVKSTHV